uniref:SAP domain-containing protein n=1 Tax=Otus sunia TaxID=257818 RepID=A0A8C8AEC7_9STRI
RASPPAQLAELKQECLARGLEAKGNKQDLINRLQAYLEEHGGCWGAPRGAPSPSPDEQRGAIGGGAQLRALGWTRLAPALPGKLQVR